MTAVTAAADRPRLDMGRVVKTTFGSIKRNIVVFGLFSAVLVAAPDSAIAWLGYVMKAAGASSDETSGVALLGRIVDLIASAVLTGALAYGVVEDLAGRRPAAIATFRAGLRNSAKVFGIKFLVGLVSVLAAILLIVPGVILALRWSMAAPAGVIEGVGVNEAINRSAILTRGNRWAILGLTVALFLLVLLFVFLVNFVIIVLQTLVAPGEFGGIATAVTSGVASGLLGMFLAAGSAVTYAELRSMSEGVLPDQLASVFD